MWKCVLLIFFRMVKLALATYPEIKNQRCSKIWWDLVKRRRTRRCDAFRLTQFTNKRELHCASNLLRVVYVWWGEGVGAIICFDWLVSSRAAGTRRRVQCTCTRDIDPTARRWCGRRGTFGRRCCSRPVSARPRSSWTRPAPLAALAVPAAAEPAAEASPAAAAPPRPSTPTTPAPQTGIWTRCPTRTRPWLSCSRAAERRRPRWEMRRPSASLLAFALRCQILKIKLSKLWI